MIRSILVPMDGSKAANSALENALDLAQITGAELRGLFVEDESELFPLTFPTAAPDLSLGTADTNVLPAALSEYLIKEWERTGERLRSCFEQNCQLMHVKGDFAVLRGIARGLIVEQAKTVDLVVMGRRGQRTSPQGKGTGSHTEAVLMTTTRPVLVVPAGTKRTGRILMAYDGSKAAQRAVEWGAFFAKLQVSKLDVLTVANADAEAFGPQEEAGKFLAPYNLDVSFVVKPGHPASVISQYALEIEAGLIVMGAHGHSRLVEMIFGSTTRDVLENARCPVLLAA
jgi:nucleotide-binding universal stress UspA family protein